MQAELKEKGQPWERAKAFDGSAVVGGFVPLKELGKPVDDLAFTLHNHDQMVQSGNSSDMLFSVDRLIAEVSTFMTLKMGDLIFTGTPAGVAPVQPGDRLTGRLEGRELFAASNEPRHAPFFDWIHGQRKDHGGPSDGHTVGASVSRHRR